MNEETTSETTEATEDAAPPMNRAERRHLKKSGGSLDTLQDLRNAQSKGSAKGPNAPTPAPPTQMKRGSQPRRSGKG